MAASGLPIHLIGLYQDAFMKLVDENTLDFSSNIEFFDRKAGPDGSVDSSKVSSIMKAIGQNPSEAEIQVG